MWLRKKPSQCARSFVTRASELAERAGVNRSGRQRLQWLQGPGNALTYYPTAPGSAVRLLEKLAHQIYRRIVGECNVQRNLVAGRLVLEICPIPGSRAVLKLPP
ncbi:hypothetical protein A9K55_001771 [Cordyceps militaris]|uniref:Uncharacterized protein n=1 Tax=Cordyceps militaris TaxID=73501 RepID=A0A2H4SQZ7_CORMI|nr:hypothetical protein A9K55_001771 [Cordyceps militaris]